MKIVAGKNKGNKLKYLKDNSVRATSHKVREALFDIIMSNIDKAIFLDVFAGSGAIGLEALSRGAKKVVFIESNNRCAKIIKNNLEITDNIDKGLILKKDYIVSLNILEKKKCSFDYIFLDPPYNKGFVNKALVSLSKLSLLKKSGTVIVQHHKKESTENPVENLCLVKQKKYSESILSFYKSISA